MIRPKPQIDRALRTGACALGLLFACGASAGAQTGIFVGSVSAPSGSPVADVRVIVSHHRTHETTTMVSDAMGKFTSPSLAIGLYDLRAQKAGYAELVEDGVALKDGVRSLDLTMRPPPALPGSGGAPPGSGPKP